MGVAREKVTVQFRPTIDAFVCVGMGVCVAKKAWQATRLARKPRHALACCVMHGDSAQRLGGQEKTHARTGFEEVRGRVRK